MKRKTQKVGLAVLFAVFLCAMTLAVVSACDNKESLEIIEDEGVYEYYYEQEFCDKHADGVKIDGKLDEDIYVNAKWLYHGDEGITYKVTTSFDEYGVYIGAVAYDSKIIYRARYDLDMYVGSNSGFTFYVTRADNNIDHPSYNLKLETDAKGRRSYSQQRFEAYSVVEGELNNATTSITTEAFVSWKALGLADGETLAADDIPEVVKVEPLYRHITVAADDMYMRSWIYPSFTEPTFLHRYPQFGADGYLYSDDRYDDSAIPSGSRLGDAVAGHMLAKTGTWDMSHYLDFDDDEYVGYVQPSMADGDSQTLYFKDVYAENFYAETYAYSDSEGGAIGLVAGDSFDRFRSVFIWTDQVPKFVVADLTYYPNRYWTSNWIADIEDENYTNGELLHFEMLKKGDAIFVFINDILVYSDRQDWYAGSYAPGLFALKCDAKFRGYNAKALTEAEALEMFAERNVSPISLSYDVRSGGVVKAAPAVGFKDPIMLDIAAPVGMVVSSIKIGGEEKLTDYLTNVKAGRYVPSFTPDENGNNPLVNRDGITEITVEFESVADRADNIALGYGYKRYMATLIGTDGNLVVGANVTIVDKGNPSVYYTAQTGENGTFDFNGLPVKGESIANGVEASGEYTVSVTANGYEKLTYEITVDPNFGKDTNGTVTEEKSLLATILGGSVTVDGETFDSDVSGWTITMEDENKANAEIGNNGNTGMKRVVFTGAKSDTAVIDFTLVNQTPFGDSNYDQYPGFGVALLNGNLGNGLAMIVVGGQVRLINNLVWDGTSVAYDVQYAELFGTHLEANRNKEVKLRFVLKDGVFAVFVYSNEDGEWKYLYSEYRADFDRECGFALFTTGDPKIAVLKYITILTGDEANAAIVADLEKPETTLIYDKNKLTVELQGTLAPFLGVEETYIITPQDGYAIQAICPDAGNSPQVTYDADGLIAEVRFVPTKGYTLRITAMERDKAGSDIALGGGTAKTAFPPEYEYLTTGLKQGGNRQWKMSPIAGIELDTTDFDPSGGNWGNGLLKVKPTVTDFSEFEYLDYVIDVRNQWTRYFFVVNITGQDGKEFGYTIGNKVTAVNTTSMKATRISRDGTKQVVTDLHDRNDGMWFGIDLWGGSERCEDVAVWRLKLKDNVFQYVPEYSIDRIWDGDGSTTQPGIAYSTLDWTNVTGLSFAFNFGYAQGKNTFGNIYGVKSDGTRVLIFEGSKAISRGITYMDANHIPAGGSNPVLNANDFTYVAYSMAGVDAPSGVTIAVNRTVDAMQGIAFGDSFEWLVINAADNNAYDLTLYDALAFDVDTTVMSEGTALDFSLLLRGKHNDASGAAQPRTGTLYLVGDNGTVKVAERFSGSHDRLLIPAGFKGTAIALLDDFTANANIRDIRTMVVPSNCFVILTESGMNGEIFNMYNFRFITNGRELIVA